MDTAGNRFIQDAVLLKPDWLVSAAIDPMEANDVAVGFPAKTLLARAGAVTIDANITLNEDENEQEREVRIRWSILVTYCCIWSSYFAFQPNLSS